ncbi:HpcH/HpaI aldolase/citrate lyase family protein [Clostridium sp. MB40-C1]|uniref:HpcH/HpaI aldolase/citrate lyase family protein n=1 Tax=Clostridium sp. MB40-C1 TaxID=3070996 RepID=UPI0027DFD6F0|nr:HpcH/HpaI aldolase/citrate lyase family protein [Clostridium sp. MB40-C1]WMJ79899.1 HpcH/HpaI aldolase/citrate lyase family protein [Clostridium sp. MB40-C1]
MKFFSDLSAMQKRDIFYKEPNDIINSTPKEFLAYSLGATLYMPALREDMVDLILKHKYERLSSMVLCLEDSIPEDKVEEAEENLKVACRTIKQKIEEEKFNEEDLPLIFVRVRSINQFKRLLEEKDIFEFLTGFCFPKFDSNNGEEYLSILKSFNDGMKHTLYAMPILESKPIIYKESRIDELLRIKEIFEKYKKYILNIRIGGTDFLGLYSIRRSIDNSIYDIRIVSDCICDILNLFLRAEDEYVVSGPVWEYFNSSPDNRVLKSQLRKSPFIEHLGENGELKRKNYLEKCIDGLIKEVILDKANGVIGKTIIHPSHIAIVNALYVVTKEEYEDALAIIDTNRKGAYKSKYNNKMNEVNPHTNWAKKILKRAYVYGVFNDDKSYVDLF